jgi:hypothetical protein
MPIKLLVASQEFTVPVSLALRHLRALPDDTELVSFLLRAATAVVEDYTGRSLIRQTYVLQLENWPCFAEPYGIRGPGYNGGTLSSIALERTPLVAINSVKYYPEAGGVVVTWDVANYFADSVAIPGRLVFADGVTLPAVAKRPDAIEIEFTAGPLATVTAPNAMLSLAVMQLARHLYDNPSAVDAEGKVTEMPLSFRHLLRSQRV